MTGPQKKKSKVVGFGLLAGQGPCPSNPPVAESRIKCFQDTQTRKPNLTSLDFIFWEHVKNLVNVEKFQGINHLSQKIIAFVATVTQSTL